MTSQLSRALIRHLHQDLLGKGMDPSFVESSEQIPYDTIVVPIEGRDETAGWQLELSFLPVLDEDSDDAALLQCFAGLPVEIAENSEWELIRLIAMLNSKLPLVGFGYLEQDKLLFFRHVLMLSKQDLGATEKLVTEAIYMIGYLLNNFAPLVTALASGQQSLQEAISSSQFGYIFTA